MNQGLLGFSEMQTKKTVLLWTELHRSCIAAGDGEAICNVLSQGDTKGFIWLGLLQAVTGILSLTIAPLKYK